MRINRLDLTNFRGFERLEVEFQERLTLLVGENGSGKTSLLEALCVALGGWLSGFEGIESHDKRNFIKADIRTISSSVNSALLEQVPVIVKCNASLPSWNSINWTRSLLSIKGKTTTAGLRTLRLVTDHYNSKIYSGEDEGIILPLVAYYSVARQWNEPIRREYTVSRDRNRLSGYKKAIIFSNSIRETMYSIDRLVFLAYQYEDAQEKIAAINAAIQTSLDTVLPGIYVYYDMHRAQFCVKDDEGLITPYSLLSDGYRGITSLIFDICMRIMTLNPQLGADAIKETSGVVLVDEIDLHLHPRWQQKVLDDLLRIFPKIQFIVTSHAPSVIQSVKKENLVILDENKAYYPSQSVYGRDVNSILVDIMGAKTRPEAIDKEFSDIYRLIDNGDIVLAEEKANALEGILGDRDPDLTAIKVAIELESLEDEV